MKWIHISIFFIKTCSAQQQMTNPEIPKKSLTVSFPYPLRYDLNGAIHTLFFLYYSGKAILYSTSCITIDKQYKKLVKGISSSYEQMPGNFLPALKRFLVVIAPGAFMNDACCFNYPAECYIKRIQLNFLDIPFMNIAYARSDYSVEVAYHRATPLISVSNLDSWYELNS